MVFSNSNKFGKVPLKALLPIAFLLNLAFPQSATASGDTILVCTKPGANVQSTKEKLAANGCTILNEIVCKTGKFSILQVKPNDGNINAAIHTISAKIGTTSAVEKTPTSAVQANAFLPNDPSFPVQYHLQSMKWPEARATLQKLGITQRAIPRITVIDTGCTPVPAGGEMINIQQFNFAGGVNGISEPPFCADLHGTAVAAVAAARTDNGSLTSGVASNNLPVMVTSCRVGNTSTLDTLDVLRAMTWCVDNQAVRGGPGAINLSINTLPANPLPTYNGSSVVQQIARTARQQGDLLVNGVGNDGILDPSPERFMRRVMGFDVNNVKWSFSRYGPFKAGCNAENVYTISQNVAVPASGTSLACPQWAGIISLLQSLNPKLNAVQADAIVYRTARSTADGYKIPDINKAVLQAVYSP